MGLVTARFSDGSAAVYNTVGEALDQASYDAETGYRSLRDVIAGAHEDQLTVEDPTVLAGPPELSKYRAEWTRRWGQVAGVLMPREDVERYSR